MNNNRKPAASVKHSVKASTGFHHAQSMKGLSYSSYDDRNDLLVRLEADEFRVDQRKFWIFNVRPFKEATINNARIELFLDNENRPGADIFSSAGKFFSLNSTGRAGGGRDLISRVIINGLDFSLMSADGLISAFAEKAYLDIGKKRMKLVNASIVDRAGSRIVKSSIVFWNDGEGAFEVPGEYTETAGGIVSAGNGLTIKIKKL